MTAKEYLSQARSIKIKLEAMAEQLAFLKSTALCIVPQYSDTPKPATQNIRKNEDAVIRVMDYEERIRKQYAKLDEITSVINAVSDPSMQVVLTKRYFGHEKWREIATDLYISTAHVYRLHNTALDEVEKLIANESK